jgi:hypothetical protein
LLKKSEPIHKGVFSFRLVKTSRVWHTKNIVGTSLLSDLIMKKNLFVSACFSLLATALVAEEPIRHILVMGDESRGQVHYLDQFNTNNNFSVKAARPVWDMKRIAENRYRYVHGNSFTVIDLKERKDVETFSDPKLEGLTTVCDLPDGGFLAGTNQKAGTPAKVAAVIYRFSADRQLKAKSVFEGINKMRMMTVLENGELLLAHNDGVSRCTLAPEGSEQGKILQTFKLPRGKNAYKALPRQEGGFWVTGGYAEALYAYSTEGEILKTFEAQQPGKLKNHFYGGLCVQSNGNLMVANWTGHGANDGQKGWQVIEFDATGKVVWYLHDPVSYGSISGIDLLR